VKRLNGIDPIKGQSIFVDLAGGDGDEPDSLFAADDKTNIGDLHPDMLYGSNINLEYKAFDFLITLKCSKSIGPNQGINLGTYPISKNNIWMFTYFLIIKNLNCYENNELPGRIQTGYQQRKSNFYRLKRQSIKLIYPNTPRYWDSFNF
jgi:hypothetical protein